MIIAIINIILGLVSVDFSKDELTKIQEVKTPPIGVTNKRKDVHFRFAPSGYG